MILTSTAFLPTHANRGTSLNGRVRSMMSRAVSSSFQSCQVRVEQCCDAEGGLGSTVERDGRTSCSA